MNQLINLFSHSILLKLNQRKYPINNKTVVILLLLYLLAVELFMKYFQLQYANEIYIGRGTLYSSKYILYILIIRSVIIFSWLFIFSQLVPTILKRMSYKFNTDISFFPLAVVLLIPQCVVIIGILYIGIEWTYTYYSEYYLFLIPYIWSSFIFGAWMKQNLDMNILKGIMMYLSIKTIIWCIYSPFLGIKG